MDGESGAARSAGAGVPPGSTAAGHAGRRRWAAGGARPAGGAPDVRQVLVGRVLYRFGSGALGCRGRPRTGSRLARRSDLARRGAEMDLGAGRTGGRLPLPGSRCPGPANTVTPGPLPPPSRPLHTVAGLLSRSRSADRPPGARRRPSGRRGGTGPPPRRMRTLRDPRHTERLHQQHDQCKLRSADCFSLSPYDRYALDAPDDAGQTGPGSGRRGRPSGRPATAVRRPERSAADCRPPFTARRGGHRCSAKSFGGGRCPSAGVPPSAAAGSVPNCVNTGKRRA